MKKNICNVRNEPWNTAWGKCLSKYGKDCYLANRATYGPIWADIGDIQIAIYRKINLDIFAVMPL